MEKDPELRVRLQNEKEKAKDRMDTYLSGEVKLGAKEEHKIQQEPAPVAVPNSEEEKRGDYSIPEVD